MTRTNLINKLILLFTISTYPDIRKIEENIKLCIFLLYLQVYNHIVIKTNTYFNISTKNNKKYTISLY